VQKAGGEVRGGVKSPEGLVERVRREFGITRADAEASIESAVGQTITAREEKRDTRQGGSPVKIYVFNPSKTYAENTVS
jgi:hypothetical protein